MVKWVCNLLVINLITGVVEWFSVSNRLQRKSIIDLNKCTILSNGLNFFIFSLQWHLQENNTSVMKRDVV
jgi:hypothetical protein